MADKNSITYASDAVFAIRGKAPTSATLNVSIDGTLQNYTRPANQEEFAIGLNAYSTTKKYQEVKVEAVDTDNTTTPPTTIKTMQRGKAYIEATPESFTYDDNGNLISDGRWNYSWNEDNRIRDMETSYPARDAGAKVESYTFTYDWTGRKIRTDYYVHEGSWRLVYTNKRYYDDYNLIYETTEYYDGTTTDVRKYYYGTDLLGSVYGSGGTGGLRMMSINGEDLFAFNNQVGSVEALFGAESDTSAQVKAEYIYSSYGEVMMKSGDLADKNNITYSTRYQEGTTGLVSYTYRHYSPQLKKWLSKDPIAESGGVNLYQMVENQPITNFDLLGYFSFFDVANYFTGGGSFLTTGFLYTFTDLFESKAITVYYYLPFVTQDHIKKIRDSISPLIETACSSRSSQKKELTLRVRADGPYRLTVGYFTISGYVRVQYDSVTCTWSAKGYFSGLDDSFDFNKADHRKVWEEYATTAGRFVTNAFGFKPMKIKFIGELFFSDSGRCNGQ